MVCDEKVSMSLCDELQADTWCVWVNPKRVKRKMFNWKSRFPKEAPNSTIRHVSYLQRFWHHKQSFSISITYKGIGPSYAEPIYWWVVIGCWLKVKSCQKLNWMLIGSPYPFYSEWVVVLSLFGENVMYEIFVFGEQHNLFYRDNIFLMWISCKLDFGPINELRHGLGDLMGYVSKLEPMPNGLVHVNGNNLGIISKIGTHFFDILYRFVRV